MALAAPERRKAKLGQSRLYLTQILSAQRQVVDEIPHALTGFRLDRAQASLHLLL
jgi:hypothetical protein